MVCDVRPARRELSKAPTVEEVAPTGPMTRWWKAEGRMIPVPADALKNRKSCALKRADQDRTPRACVTAL